jgi:hypothetical protein
MSNMSIFLGKTIKLTFFSVSTKDFLERPLAGSQVQLCLLDSKILNSWSHVDPGTFRVRGANYFR